MVCALGAACALAFAAQLVAWWSYPEAKVFLLRSARCFGGECQAAGHTWLGASAWWHRLSAATFGVGLAAALLAVAVAAGVASGRTPRTAAGSLLVAVITALACAVASVLTFPRLGPGLWSWGAPLYLLGLGLAAASAIAARRAPAPD
ncbi:MAG: hypothetical protein R3B48_09870 [Kofleriaceae bacterium]